MGTIRRSHATRALPGQTLVLFALLSMLLLAGLGLIIDGGYEYAQRRIMQNAADTAALRGARVIAQQSLNPSSSVLQAVVDSAIANGVSSAARVRCDYLDNSRNLIAVSGDSECKNNVLLPVTVTGVRVRVSEVHTPIVMRALGIMETGTAATAAAQVRALTVLDSADVPFAVCGMNTMQTNGSSFDILQTEIVVAPSASPSPVPASIERVTGTGDFNATNVFSYDWNQRETNGDFTLQPGAPTAFLIYGSGIGDCLLTGWKGLASHDSAVVISDRTVAGLKFANVQEGNSTGVGSGTGRLDPERTIDGVLGCRPNTTPDDCVLILPIVFNEMECLFCTPETYSATFNGGTSTLFFARWGAFLMNNEGSGNYSGRLIKNYPIQATGKNYWSPTWQEPLTVTLVRLP